jgi:hypothetical protein
MTPPHWRHAPFPHLIKITFFLPQPSSTTTQLENLSSFHINHQSTSFPAKATKSFSFINRSAL